jgi:hypothetical protein
MNQHTVSKCLLKHFTRDKKHRVWAYDKHTGRKFQPNIRNITAERGFYDLAAEGAPQISIDPGLRDLEGRTAPLIAEIVKRKSIAFIDGESRETLATFFAALLIRTKEHRLQFRHIGRLLRERLRQMGATEELLASFTSDEGGSKLAGLQSLLEDVPRFAPHFLNKVWALFEAPRDRPLYISDNPVTLQNGVDHSPRGSIGLAVRGIEIYIPFSSGLTLGLLCPSVAEPFRRAARSLRVLPEPARALCTGLETGTPIRLAGDNVTRMNSLQVVYSSRFVYCEADDFSLVEEMLRHDPRLREGAKPTLA